MTAARPSLTLNPLSRKAGSELAIARADGVAMELELSDGLAWLVESMRWRRYAFDEARALAREALRRDGADDGEADGEELLETLVVEEVLVEGDPFERSDDLRALVLPPELMSDYLEPYIKGALSLRAPFRITSDGLGVALLPPATPAPLDWGADDVVFVYRGYVHGEDPAAEKLAADKHRASAALRAAGIPAPRGMLLPVEGWRDEIATHELDGRDWVLKPFDGGLGDGVTVGIRTVDDVARALDGALADSERNGWPRPTAMRLEERVAGDVFRAWIADGEVLGLGRRRPPRVTGDGSSTIRQLVEAENARRGRYADDGTFEPVVAMLAPIPLDAAVRFTLSRQGLALDDVLEAGRTVQVDEVLNIKRGSVYEDASALLHPTQEERLRRAAEVSGLVLVGVDYLALDIEAPADDENGVVVELNAQTGLAYHAVGVDIEPFVGRGVVERLLAARARRRLGPVRVPLT